MSLLSRTPLAVEYPETDDEPMAENMTQRRWIVTIMEGLDHLFADRPDVLVAGDLFWYPVEGEPKVQTAPDVLVVFGRPKGDRRSYMQWEEDDHPPDVVFEILSPSNRPTAMNEKLHFYERHGVREYYIYDPDEVELVGFLRSGEALRPIPKMNGWTSPLLGVRFETSGPELVIRDPAGKPFRPVQESLKELDSVKGKLGESLQREDHQHARAEANAAERDRIARERDEIARLRALDQAQAEANAAERDGIARERDEIARSRALERARAEAFLEALRAAGIEPPEIG